MNKMVIKTINLEDLDLEDKTFMSRLNFDDAYIQGLAEDIEKLGQRNPISLRPKGEKFQVIYGWQRIKAARALETGLHFEYF